MSDPPNLVYEQQQVVAEAYFQRMMTAPDAARDRAERSYTIAGAVGATLLGAGVISGISSGSTTVTTLGVLALALWAIAAALFVRAVGSPVNPVPDEYVEPEEFVHRVRELAKEEKEEIDKRSRVARAFAGLAVLVTLGALIAAAVEPVSRGQRTLMLSAKGAEVVARACGRPATTRVAGELLSALDAHYLTFKPKGGDCPQISLAREEVIAVLG